MAGVKVTVGIIVCAVLLLLCTIVAVFLFSLTSLVSEKAFWQETFDHTSVYNYFEKQGISEQEVLNTAVPLAKQIALPYLVLAIVALVVAMVCFVLIGYLSGSIQGFLAWNGVTLAVSSYLSFFTISPISRLLQGILVGMDLGRVNIAAEPAKVFAKAIADRIIVVSYIELFVASLLMIIAILTFFSFSSKGKKKAEEVEEPKKKKK